MNLNNKLKQIKKVIQHPQNVNIKYQILNRDGDYQ